MKKKDCEGCLSINEDIDDNDCCIWFNKGLICPCSICLVKVMCVCYCNPMKEYMKISIEEKRNA